MEELLQQISSEIKELKTEVTRMKDSVGRLKTDFAELKVHAQKIAERLDDATAQQAENTEMITAIRYSQEEVSANLDGIKVNTASKESLQELATKTDIKRLTAKFEALNSRLSDQENELYQLKGSSLIQ